MTSIHSNSNSKWKTISFITIWLILILTLIGCIIYKNKQETISTTLAKASNINAATVCGK